MPSSGPSPVDTGQSSDPTGGPTIAVAHYPEGAGHATRMLAVADELERRGASVRMAGGGAGTRFVELNGHDEFEPATVDYIDTFQGGSTWQVLSESVPATARRVTDYVEWLDATAPDALVTDDMFAAMAALRTDVPLYVLKHDMPGLYRNRVERAGASFHTEFQATAAREFFYPAVWPAEGLAPEGATRVAPVALEGAGSVADADVDVVVVPSHYSELGRIATALEREGYDVLDVGSDDWDAVPSLLPYLRAADAVVCSGYSTVMDAAVAGTPCVVHPATDEQAAVADRLRHTPGFAVAEGPLGVLEAVADPPAAPESANGAPAVAAGVLADLRDLTGATGDGADTDPVATAETPLEPGHGPPARRARARLGRARRRLGRDAARVRDGTVRAGRTLLTALRERVRALVAGTRAAVRGTRRLVVATAALLASVAVFGRGRLGRTRDAAGTTLYGVATDCRRLAGRGLRAAATVARRVGDAAAALGEGLVRTAGGLRDAVADSGRGE
jgi:hypothetical protein